MTEATRLALRLSEIRQRLNELGGAEDLTDEQRAEIDALTVEYRDAETKRRALIVAGDAGGEGDAGNGDDLDAETRELRRLEDRAQVANYVGAAMEMRAASGAELEYNQALGIGGERFPLRLLAPRETRATTDADAGATQRRWLDRLFADTAAMRLGVTFESVEPGVSAHPVTTAGASAAQRGRGEAAADAAWTVGVTEIKPTRNTVRAVFSMEDAARLAGLEDALNRDLRAALTEGVDRAVFVGDAEAGEDRADIVGLTTAAIGEVTLAQAAKVKAPDTLAAFVGLIDGKHAASLDDLNVVAAVGANTLWHGTIANAAASNETIAQFLMASGLDWGVRGELETATDAGDFGAFIGRGRGVSGAAVAAVWDSGMLVRDPYSEAAKGEVALTLSHLWGFGIPRPSNFKRLKFTA